MTVYWLVLLFFSCKDGVVDTDTIRRNNDPRDDTISEFNVRALKLIDQNGIAIPEDDNRIEALIITPKGIVYGATSGKNSYLFQYTPKQDSLDYVIHIPLINSVYHGLIYEEKSHRIYIAGSRIQSPNKMTSHLLLWDLEDQQFIELVDLLKDERIVAFNFSHNRGELYGLTAPRSHFFTYNISTGSLDIIGAIAQKETRYKAHSISRALLEKDDIIYGSGHLGRLFMFSINTRDLEQTNIAIPGIKGRSPLIWIDAMVQGPDGRIFGGTSDGYIFRFLTSERKIENLGKPVRAARIRGLVYDKSGVLYGIAGEHDGMCTLFSYDTVRSVHRHLGFIEDRKLNWRGYQFDSMAISENGTIYIGESERKSHLFILSPLSK